MTFPWLKDNLKIDAYYQMWAQCKDDALYTDYMWNNNCTCCFNHLEIGVKVRLKLTSSCYVWFTMEYCDLLLYHSVVIIKIITWMMKSRGGVAITIPEQTIQRSWFDYLPIFLCFMVYSLLYLELSNKQRTFFVLCKKVSPNCATEYLSLKWTCKWGIFIVMWG